MDPVAPHWLLPLTTSLAETVRKLRIFFMLLMTVFFVLNADFL